jgi:hypothetical protein
MINVTFRLGSRQFEGLYCYERNQNGKYKRKFMFPLNQFKSNLIIGEINFLEGFLNLSPYKIEVVEVNGEKIDCLDIESLSTMLEVFNLIYKDEDLFLVEVYQDLAYLGLLQMCNDSVKSMEDEDYKLELEKIKNLNLKELNSKSKTKNVSGYGYVYMIVDEINKVCKIGKSVNPDERIKSLQTSYPHKLTLKQKVKTNNMDVLERHIHKKYKEYKLQGEWFKDYVMYNVCIKKERDSIF